MEMSLIFGQTPRLLFRAGATMKLTIEEIGDPINHQGRCVECGSPPRHVAVLPPNSAGRTRGAFTLCDDCANNAALLDKLAVMAEGF
jgi:hypothetical protein